MKPIHYLSFLAGLSLVGFGAFVLGAVASTFAIDSSGGHGMLGELRTVLLALVISLIVGTGFLYVSMKNISARAPGAATRVYRLLVALFVSGFVYDLVKAPDSLKLVGCLAFLLAAVLMPVKMTQPKSVAP